MMVALQLSDYSKIMSDATLAQLFMDAVEEADQHSWAYGIYLDQEDECGIFGYEKEQFENACRVSEQTEQELLWQFLSEKIGDVPNKKVDVVFLEVGSL